MLAEYSPSHNWVLYFLHVWRTQLLGLIIQHIAHLCIVYHNENTKAKGGGILKKHLTAGQAGKQLQLQMNTRAFTKVYFITHRFSACKLSVKGLPTTRRMFVSTVTACMTAHNVHTRSVYIPFWILPMWQTCLPHRIISEVLWGKIEVQLCLFIGQRLWTPGCRKAYYCTITENVKCSTDTHLRRNMKWPAYGFISVTNVCSWRN